MDARPWKRLRAFASGRPPSSSTRTVRKPPWSFVANMPKPPPFHGDEDAHELDGRDVDAREPGVERVSAHDPSRQQELAEVLPEDAEDQEGQLVPAGSAAPRRPR